jgi:hypothetical protein
MFKILRVRRRAAGVPPIALLLAMIPATASAQAGCTVTSLTDPPREVLRCGGGLTIEAETATRYRLLRERQGGAPSGAEVTGRAILIELEPGLRSGFQVRTPHAIASVRGTIYAVDVDAGQTSVFVARGRVAVDHRERASPVILAAGQGVDVVPGRALEVKTWGAQRARRLLARFGR